MTEHRTPIRTTLQNNWLALLLICAVLFLSLLLAGCDLRGDSNEMKNGYYTAQDAEPEHGWKEFVTICVKNGKIVNIEYQARNASGFIKSWDMDYMRVMNASDGTYPNEYSRIYTTQFLEKQSPDIDIVSGATTSGRSFKLLTAAAMARAKSGDDSVAIVSVPHEEE
jgi:major membrane immunogen (membrane-anchored lipoprotein)